MCEDGTSVMVSDGAAGTSCTVEQLVDGVRITCPDGTTAQWPPPPPPVPCKNSVGYSETRTYGDITADLEVCPEGILVRAVSRPEPVLKRQLHARYDSTCALRDDGSGLCWGRGNATIPAGARQVFVHDRSDDSWGGPFRCVLDENGTVVCAALGITAPYEYPFAGAPKVGFGGVGFYRGCALAADGTVDCVFEYREPAVRTTAENAVAISERGDCGLEGDGSYSCWNNLNPPSFAGEKFVGLASGYASCALAPNNVVSCPYTPPTFEGIDAGDELVQIAEGQAHLCGLLRSGRIVCAGWGSSGQQDVPDGIYDFVQVVAGSQHTCAMREAGEVLCWGDDTYGQLDVPVEL